VSTITIPLPAFILLCANALFTIGALLFVLWLEREARKEHYDEPPQ
jgi:hypothetical protein